MTKRSNQRYTLLRRYKYDIFGLIARKGFRKKWIEKTQKYKVYFRDVKVIHQRIKERLSEKVKRRKIRRKEFLRKLKQAKGKKFKFKFVFPKKELYHRSFFYRVDIIKLIPKRKKKTLFGKILRRRHKLRLFGSQMGVRQLRSYLKKSSRNSRMLKKFLELFESRLDIFLYRLNWVWNSAKGRQDINHKSFTINGKISTFPSQCIHLFDLVSVIKHNWFYRHFMRRIRRALSLIMRKLPKRLKTKINFKRRFPLTRLFLRKKKKRGRGKKKKFILSEIIFNVPPYIEVNFRTFTAMFVRSPKLKEIFLPFKIRKYKLPGITKQFPA